MPDSTGVPFYTTIANGEEQRKWASDLRREAFRTSPFYESFDAFCDHLLVLDRRIRHGNPVVATYRLLPGRKAEKGFYSGEEFDLGALIAYSPHLLELGGACIAPEYRKTSVLLYLWKGLGKYIAEIKPDIVFGCASFDGTDHTRWQEALSYMHRTCLSEEPLYVRPYEQRRISLLREVKKTVKKDAFRRIPPLLRGYIQFGARISDGAVCDPVMETLDVCVVAPVQKIQPALHYFTRAC